MITSISSYLFVTWSTVLLGMNFSSGFLLFGLYYGFLSTLPIGPSQLVSVRAFLSEGNFGGAVAVSGLMTGQLIIFLSIYYSPLYAILVKPQIFTLSVLPYIFFYWYRIKDLLNYQSLRSIVSFHDTRIFGLFFDSMIFQLLNPILLPSPVLARLLNLFLFRYSNNLFFLGSVALGWLCGQYLFIYSSKFLRFRIESDSRVLYLLVKRVIHRTFSIIILGFSLLYLGRTPIPFITKKIIDNQPKREEFLFAPTSWITHCFFDHRRWRRPFRYISNSRFSTRSPVKRKVSQYFFNICSSDGRFRLSFTYLPSLAILEKSFAKYLKFSGLLPADSFSLKWIGEKESKRESLYDEFRRRILFLEHGIFLGQVGEKRLKIWNPEGNIFTKFYDPLLMRQSHEALITSKPPWFLMRGLKNKQQYLGVNNRIERNNKLKNWLSNQWQELEDKNSVLPWEPLTRSARRTLSLLIDKSKNLKFDTNLKRINEDTMGNFSSKPNPSLGGGIRKRVHRKSNINWELILNLSSQQRTTYFNYLQTDERNTLIHSWTDFLLGIQFKKIYSLLLEKSKSDNQFRFKEMNKEIPRWVADLRNDKFDVIAIGVTDIRQRKVKNLGYLTKGEDKRRKIVRRFSQQSDFRRELIKGSMRARRRKTLIWRFFQLGINSPFFLRITEKPMFFQTFLSRQIRNRSAELTLQNTSVKKSFLEKTRADRLAIANRWDFPLAQWGRSWLLIVQSHFRKYLVLPILITLKNLGRFSLFQNTEWNEDWFEWGKEIHIRCTYDGTEVSEKELPEQWLRDGLQIKIVYPFRLKPWHNPRSKNEYLGKNGKHSKNFIKKRKFHYCYLTAWGFLTDLPFGNIKKRSSFWKPIQNELRKKRKRNTYFDFLKLVKKRSPGISNIFGSRTDNTLKISTESYFNELTPNREYGTIDVMDDTNRNSQSAMAIYTNIESRIKQKNLHDKLDHIQNLEDFIAGKDEKTEINLKRNQSINFLSYRRKTELLKGLIRVKQIIIRFGKKVSQSINQWLFLLRINVSEIKTNFELWIEIAKEVIREFFDRNHGSNHTNQDNRNDRNNYN